jgi:hypothetical protein
MFVRRADAAVVVGASLLAKSIDVSAPPAMT